MAHALCDNLDQSTLLNNLCLQFKIHVWPSHWHHFEYRGNVK